MGTSGYSGSGISGYSGSGVSGWSGYSGIGIPGSTGISGYSGKSGWSGFAGDRYTTASSDSLSIGAGDQNLTVGTGLSYAVGQIAVIANSVSNYMYGPVSAYIPSTGAMTVAVSNVVGAGTFSDWEVSLQGAAGPQGIQGTSGYSGISGYSGSGLSGFSGKSGWSGLSGYSGIATSGYSGISGWSGNSGYSGVGASAGNTVVSQLSFGLSATSGILTTFSREDHAHGTPSLPDADAFTKGVVKIAGDLGGTAALPTVPGLTVKVTNPMVAIADLIIGGAAGAPARLAKGSAYQALTMDSSGTSIVWADVKSIQQNAQTNSYVLVASDNGKHVSITTGGVTIPAGVFNIGNAITIYNNSAVAQTITQGSSVTLRLSPAGTTGNRTLAGYGLVTILCVNTNEFVITGSGLS
jgi:hypothetical protein